MITDIHYADKDTRGTRHYRDSIEKVGRAIEHFNRTKPEFVVELGDFIDAAGGDVDVELSYLDRIERLFAQYTGERHYVLGNHCIDILTKDEFIENSGAREPHYSFDHGEVHFIVLDACYRAAGLEPRPTLS